MIALSVILLIFFSGQNKEQHEGPDGNYAFEKGLYLNHLSSAVIHDHYTEYYTFTNDSLIVTGEAGNKREYTITYKKTAVNRQDFENEFLPFTSVDISDYQERYQLTDDSESYPYRVYAMDDEIWLARLNTSRIPSGEEIQYIWSIFKIVKYDQAIP